MGLRLEFLELFLPSLFPTQQVPDMVWAIVDPTQKLQSKLERIQALYRFCWLLSALFFLLGLLSYTLGAFSAIR